MSNMEMPVTQEEVAQSDWAEIALWARRYREAVSARSEWPWAKYEREGRL